MTRQERLKFCKACTRQRFDTHKGIVCSLTNAPAAFDVECTMYNEDKELKHEMEMKEIKFASHTREADKAKRFLNHIIDVVFINILMLSMASLLGVYLAFFNPSAVDSLQDNMFIDYILFIVTAIIYYTLMEAKTGMTVGKFITKTKVVNADGEKPGIKVIFMRSLTRFVPFDALSFLMSIDGGWHDKWSKTRVVEIS